MKCLQLIKKPMKTSLILSSQDEKEPSHVTAKRSFASTYQLIKKIARHASVSPSQKCKALYALAFAGTLLFTLPTANAQGVFLPAPPHGVGGEDSVTTQSGTHCRTSMNSNDGYVDMGIAGGQKNGSNQGYYGGQGPQSQDSALIYMRIVVPLGDAPEKLDCGRVLELEIERLEAEIQMMRYEPD